MKRWSLLASVLATTVWCCGCDEAAHRAKEVIREQQSKAIEHAADAARESLNEKREAAQDAVGDSLRGDEKEDAAKEKEAK